MVAHPILEGEIAKRGIKKKAVAQCIGVCNKSLNNKMTGRVPFTWPEVKKIRRQFFPDLSPDVLFAEAGEDAQFIRGGKSYEQKKETRP